MKNRSELLALVAILLCTSFYGVNIYSSTGIYDLNDGLAHFAIARYAPAHPALFLDHWGKPLFTFISSPFTAFGIKGVMFLNTLLFALTSWFLVRICKELKLSFAWAAPLLLAFMPVYFQTVMGGLTEVLFAALLTAALLAFSKERFLLAAFIVSWLPFARSEAYFIVPLFAIAFALKKQAWPLLTLAFASVLMSVIGGLVFGDFLWMIHNNPYVGAADIYGSGDFWHFADHANGVFGMPNAILALTAIVIILYSLIKNIYDKQNLVLQLAAACAVFVFLGHSYFWWKGLYGSLGLLRVMATVMPLIVLLAIYTLHKLNYLQRLWQRRIIVFGVVVFGIINLWSFQPVAKMPETQEAMVQELAAWYKNSEYANNPNVWYMYPPIGYYLGIDNFEKLDSRQLWYLNRITPSNSIRTGGLIIYDGARSPNEGITSKEKLFADSHLKLVHQISPEYEMLEMNESPFEFLVFEKQLQPKGDTLIDEDFTASRPVLEGRLNRIATDTAGRRCFIMLTLSHYIHVFTFWKEDMAAWQAPKFEFTYEADEALEVYLSIVHKDGTEDDLKWQTGIFELPAFENDVVNISVSLRNPHPNEEIRVYNWMVRKVFD